ncbi:hypothetical protein DL95DRAFT_470701 [Leptodontidium sp. 2 PMI_412]|nr:hypothetical protein DL95DRAFT_470701 [Leptodontidium sp. 2 PMI_412]
MTAAGNDPEDCGRHPICGVTTIFGVSGERASSIAATSWDAWMHSATATNAEQVNASLVGGPATLDHSDSDISMSNAPMINNNGHSAVFVEAIEASSVRQFPATFGGNHLAASVTLRDEQLKPKWPLIGPAISPVSGTVSRLGHPALLEG